MKDKDIFYAYSNNLPQTPSSLYYKFLALKNMLLGKEIWYLDDKKLNKRDAFKFILKYV